MVEFLELLGEVVGNILGLTLETTGELVGRYLSLIKRAAILWGIALLVSCGLYGLGYYENRGLFFGLGTGLTSVATLAWLIIVLPIWMAIQKAAEKSPTFAQIRNIIVTLTLGFTFLTLYIPLSHAWKNSNLFPILLAMSAFLTLMAVLTGKSISPDTLVFRAKILLFVVSTLIIANAVLPEEVTARIQPLLKHQVNLEPKLISCSDSDFFESTSANPQPRVWYYMTEKGEYECYNNPGSHPKTGQRLIAIDTATAKKILQQQEEIKNRAKQAVEDEKLRVEKLKNEKLKEEELRKSEAEATWQKSISQEQQEQSKPENNTPASVKLVTLDVNTAAPFSTEGSVANEVVEGILIEPVSLSSDNGKSLTFDKGTRMRMKIIHLQSANDSGGPAITLIPTHMILPNGELLGLSSDLIVIKPSVKKEFLKGLGKTLLGAAGGAGIGAISGRKSAVAEGALEGAMVGGMVAVITRGKNIEVPVGYHIKIDGVKIIQPR